MRIGFIGAGKMAEGLIAAIKCRRSLLVGARRPERGAELAARYGVKTVQSNPEVVKRCGLIFLCVEPGAVPEVAEEILPLLKPGQTLVSIVAGRSLKSLRKLFGPAPGLVRVMPNLCLLSGAGMSLVCPAPGTPEEVTEKVLDLLSMGGRTLLLPERHFEAATALSGSGPAYFAYMEEAMIQGALALGLPPKAARLLADQTMLGTALHLQKSGVAVPDFVAAISTRGGATAAGMRKLARPGFKRAVADTVKACAERAAELGRD